MLQNGSEMYDLNFGETAVRYFNGHSHVEAGMAQKKDKSRKGKMVPGKDELPSLSSSTLCTDGKLKFSDRLKALLNTGTTPNDNGMEPEDPYTFREPEPQQVLRLYQNNSSNNVNVSNRLPVCQEISENSSTSSDSAVSSKGSANSISTSQLGLYPTLSASLGHSVSMGVSTSPLDSANKHVSKTDDESSKTMNKLQAKIARNKVIGKHKRVSPTSRTLNLPSHMVKQVVQQSWHPKKERSLLEEQLLGIKSDLVVKKEPEEVAPKSYRPQQHCLPHSVISIPPKRRHNIMPSQQNATPCHEALQRIGIAQEALHDLHQDLFPLGLEISDSESSDDESKGVFQRHWFSGWQEQSDYGSRAAQAHTDTRRRLAQLVRGIAKPRDSVQQAFDSSLLKASWMYPSQSAVFLQSHSKQGQNPVRQNRAKMTMLVKRICSFKKGESDACTSIALPCTQHCLRHIMYNVDQLLFQHCTAKFSDNTQCCKPVFDISHELPLCLEHARKMDNYDKMCAETKPKKVRKKPKPSAMTRPNKRGKKKRRVQRPMEFMSTHLEDVNLSKAEQGVNRDLDDVLMKETSFVDKSSLETYIKEEVVESFSTPEMQVLTKNDHQVVENVEEVLAMEDIQLDPVELATQASRLLEEHDLTNVLNQIPADAFNDLFTEDKNGEYEPTREETEELERALEAVDKDVKSLEKLSQTQGLLETLMDDHTLVHTLGHLPEVPALTVPEQGC